MMFKTDFINTGIISTQNTSTSFHMQNFIYKAIKKIYIALSKKKKKWIRKVRIINLLITRSYNLITPLGDF